MTKHKCPTIGDVAAFAERMRREFEKHGRVLVAIRVHSDDEVDRLAKRVNAWSAPLPGVPVVVDPTCPPGFAYFEYRNISDGEDA